MRAAVVNFTCRRRRTASSPRAMARCDFPTPGGPSRIRFSARSMKAQPPSSVICLRFSEGWKEKSNSSSVFLAGKEARRVRVSVARRLAASTWAASIRSVNST